MTDKEKQILLAEIERQIEHSKHCYEFTHSNSARKFQDGEISGFKTIQKFINSLPEEPVSKDLEEAAKENAKIERSDDTEVGYDINRFGGFIDGAKWDRKHILSKIDVNAMLADYQAEVGINNYVQIYSKGIEAVLKKIKEL